MTEAVKTGLSHPTVTIEDEMKQSYLDYAMSVIVSRALPDVRDGSETCSPPHFLRHARGRIYVR
jgi:hypothetical protein